MLVEEHVTNVIRNAADNPLRAATTLLIVARDIVGADPILRTTLAMQLIQLASELDPDVTRAQRWQ